MALAKHNRHQDDLDIIKSHLNHIPLFQEWEKTLDKMGYNSLIKNLFYKEYKKK